MHEQCRVCNLYSILECEYILLLLLNMAIWVVLNAEGFEVSSVEYLVDVQFCIHLVGVLN